jgi:hypothetical protein
MKLLVIVEQTGTGYSAYSPDLPGCVAAGPSRPDVEQRMRADGQHPPEPHTYATIVEVAA